MDYMLELREFVGHRPLQMLGAAVLVVDSENHLLMMKRSDNGCWGIPGGGVELGEEVCAAAQRELFEETSLETDAMQFFGIFSGPQLFYRYPNGDEIHGVIIAYLVHDWRGELHLNDEHTEWRWFAFREIPEDLNPPIIPVIAKLKQGDAFP